MPITTRNSIGIYRRDGGVAGTYGSGVPYRIRTAERTDTVQAAAIVNSGDATYEKTHALRCPVVSARVTLAIDASLLSGCLLGGVYKRVGNVDGTYDLTPTCPPAGYFPVGDSIGSVGASGSSDGVDFTLGGTVIEKYASAGCGGGLVASYNQIRIALIPSMYEYLPIPNVLLLNEDDIIIRWNMFVYALTDAAPFLLFSAFPAGQWMYNQSDTGIAFGVGSTYAGTHAGNICVSDEPDCYHTQPEYNPPNGGIAAFPIIAGLINTGGGTIDVTFNP